MSAGPPATNPKVYLSALWRWHAYTVTRELRRHGYDAQFLTADFPRPPRDLLDYTLRPNFLYRGVQKAAARYPELSPFSMNSLAGSFDRWATGVLRGRSAREDLYCVHAWSGYSERVIEALHERNVPVVLERSCPHIDTQRETLDEERDRWKIRSRDYSRVPDDWRDKMVREYDTADLILTCSSTAAESFIRRGMPENKLAWIPLGANFPLRDTEKQPSGKFRVLSAAGPSLRKGFYYLLQAWQELALDDAELHIVSGIGSFFVRFSATPNVVWHSRLPRDRFQQLFDDCSVFCLASVDEGFGMVVTEAMARRLPVVVSDAVGATDIVEDGVHGRIFPCRDIEALKESLLYYYENREALIEHGIAAKKRVAEYSWDVYTNRLVELYQGVARSGGQ